MFDSGEKVTIHTLIDFYQSLGAWAILVSLGFNILLNILGFLPSVFLTLANVAVWGPWFGGLLSWAAEVIGSVCAFVLYRFGLAHTGEKLRSEKWERWFARLQRWSNGKQVYLIFLARCIPVLPSGVVNLFGVLAKIQITSFVLGTLLGKIPSIALEVSVSSGLLAMGKGWIQLGIVLIVGLVGYVLFRKKSET